MGVTSGILAPPLTYDRQIIRPDHAAFRSHGRFHIWCATEHSSGVWALCQVKFCARVNILLGYPSL
jgi:hypothetical protein